jgi:predicted HicB family RNase H-like nuclease
MAELSRRLNFSVSPELHRQIEQAAREHLVRPGEFVRSVLAERVKAEGGTNKREISK